MPAGRAPRQRRLRAVHVAQDLLGPGGRRVHVPCPSDRPRRQRGRRRRDVELPDHARRTGGDGRPAAEPDQHGLPRTHVERSADAQRFECRHTFPDGSFEDAECISPWPYRDLVDGQHRFEVVAFDAAGNVGDPVEVTLVVDTLPPDPVTPAAEAATFTFATTEPGTSFECSSTTARSRRAPRRPATRTSRRASTASRCGRSTAPATPRTRPRSRSRWRRRSAAGIRDADADSYADPDGHTHADARVQGDRGRAPGQRQDPRPQARQHRVRGTRRDGGHPARLDDRLPSTGRIALTIEPGEGGRSQRAVFYGGIFKVTQTGIDRRPDAQRGARACKKAKKAKRGGHEAEVAQAVGRRQGQVPHQGQYSAATVRGTKWLVQDSCDGTLTRVKQGVVAVRDNVRKKTVLAARRAASTWPSRGAKT